MRFSLNSVSKATFVRRNKTNFSAESREVKQFLCAASKMHPRIHPGLGLTLNSQGGRLVAIGLDDIAV
jgi:hypothetical protein